MKIGKKLYIVKNVTKLNLYSMKKIKLKLESFKYIIPIIIKTIKFKTKVWCYKKFKSYE